MKNIYKSGIITILLLTVFSCKKSFLDKVPGVDVTEDIIFSTRQNIESEISTMYQFGMVSIFPNRDGTVTATPTGTTLSAIGTLSAGTDECEASEAYPIGQIWNSASITPGSILLSEDVRFYARSKAIRYANILLERIDAVTDPAADAAYKTQVKGEALFIRALNNFETMKRYGGFPIVTKRFTDIESAKIPRSSFEDCVNAIVKDCDDAASKLPVIYVASQKGRAIKLAAMALKAKTLLYAASPLFNTATPYLSMSIPANNKLICYGNYDINRWKLAADAAKAVLDEAASSGSGITLIDVPANRYPTDANVRAGNYRVSWELLDNSEIIMADKTYAASNEFGYPWYHINPIVFGSFINGNSVTHTFVTKYEKANGQPEVWNMAGGDDLQAKYNELDSRFKQSVGYNNSRWDAANLLIETFMASPGFAQGKHYVGCAGGAWEKKPIPEGLANGGSVVPSIPLLRLNEFYLDYAEAQNEFAGPGSATPALPTAAITATNPSGIDLLNAQINVINSPFDAVNKIRLRSGMPPIAGLSQSQFRDRVRNERAIELAFEDHRFWDIRRWLIAEQDGVMKGPIYGIRITKLTANTFRYLPYIIETRSFNKQEYLHPFDQTEILKGTLVQNPGW